MMLQSSDRKLRLFLSVDIVGSTAYKTRVSRDEPLLWPQLYNSFLQGFGSLFQRNVLSLRALSSQPRLWKLLGDEILFSAEIRSSADAFGLTRAFYRSIYDYNADTANQEILVKGTAWTAGFPIRNFEVKPPPILDEGANGDGVGGVSGLTDYIGLDIDIGFRLSAVSRVGTLVASLDLIDILLRDADQGKLLRFDHVGWTRLKGVLEDQPYPVLWVSEDERQPKPHFPWQKYTCEFWHEYEKGTKLIPGELQALCDSVRQAWPSSLGICKPYFQDEEMPEHHQNIWNKAAAIEQSQEREDVLGMDEPLGPNDEDTQD